METAVQRLTRALIAADQAGDMQAARILAAELRRAQTDPTGDIPGLPTAGASSSPSIGEKLVGTGEAALTTATGLTGGLIGLVGGAFRGVADQILKGDFTSKEAGKAVEAAATKGAQALTYAPRTESGQEQAAAVGDFMRAVGPGPMGGMGAAVMSGARPVVPAMRAQGAEAARRGAETVRTAVQRDPLPTPGTQGSAGAAGVDAATLRQARADELPVPLRLTEGQKTRAFDDVRFERETAKDPELGAPIRERFADHNRKLVQNMDAFIDATGAEAPDLRSIGLRVNDAIRARAARDKAKIRTLYKEAEKAGELEAPVSPVAVVDVLNTSRSAESTAPVLTAARKEILRLGGAAEDQAGNLVPQPLTLASAEQLRKFVNKVTGNDPTNIKFASDVKTAIDLSTEGVGGQRYKHARRARAQYARDYEDIALVRNLIGQKRGSADRAIALEDVLNRSVLDPSTALDSVRQVRKILQTEGETGTQAWRDIQGGVLRHIRDEATKNVARNELGDPIVSAAKMDRVVQHLDKTGKLDFVFGKRGAEQLRTINEVAKDVLTVPPGSVNTSNTASVLLAAMDMAISGTAGLPAPILSGARLVGKQVKNARLRARVNKVLGE